MYDDDDKDQVLGGRRPGEASGPEGDEKAKGPEPAEGVEEGEVVE